MLSHVQLFETHWTVAFQAPLSIEIFQARILVHAKLLQSCPTLCGCMDCSPPGPSVHRILQARILEWVAMPSSRGSSLPRDWTHVTCIAGGFFTTEPPGKPTAGYYWAIKKNKLLLLPGTWGDLAGIWWLKEGRHEILHSVWFHLRWRSRIGKTNSWWTGQNTDYLLDSAWKGA